MKAILLFVVVAAVLLVGFVILRSSRSTNQLNVDPNAAGEIEKAKGR